MNIYVLARLMGHADINILRQYLPLLEGDLQEAHARFGAVAAARNKDWDRMSDAERDAFIDDIVHEE